MPSEAMEALSCVLLQWALSSVACRPCDVKHAELGMSEAEGEAGPDETLKLGRITRLDVLDG